MGPAGLAGAASCAIFSGGGDGGRERETWQRSIAAGGNEEVRRVGGEDRSGSAKWFKSNAQDARKSEDSEETNKATRQYIGPRPTVIMCCLEILMAQSDTRMVSLMARLGFEVSSFFAQLSVCL